MTFSNTLSYYIQRFTAEEERQTPEKVVYKLLQVAKAMECEAQWDPGFAAALVLNDIPSVRRKERAFSIAFNTYIDYLFLDNPEEEHDLESVIFLGNMLRYAVYTGREQFALELVTRHTRAVEDAVVFPDVKANFNLALAVFTHRYPEHKLLVAQLKGFADAAGVTDELWRVSKEKLAGTSRAWRYQQCYDRRDLQITGYLVSTHLGFVMPKREEIIARQDAYEAELDADYVEITSCIENFSADPEYLEKITGEEMFRYVEYLNHYQKHMEIFVPYDELIGPEGEQLVDAFWLAVFQARVGINGAANRFQTIAEECEELGWLASAHIFKVMGEYVRDNYGMVPHSRF